MRPSKPTIAPYIIGFGLSLGITIAAYLMVVHRWFSTTALVAGVTALAVLQLVVQLFFFLHLGQETRPRVKLVVFLFMLMVLVIVAGGSLWIMYNLDYNMMHSPSELDQTIMEDEGIRR